MNRIARIASCIVVIGASTFASGCRNESDALSVGDASPAQVSAPQMHPIDAATVPMPNDPAHRAQVDPHAGHNHAPGEGHDDHEHPTAAPVVPSGANTLAPEETAVGAGRGIFWEAPKRWPVVGEENEFRVQTFRLPAVSMDGAGECVIYRFPGGGDVQANLHRWIGQFRGPDGTADSVDAMQAERVVQGLPAWLVRASGTYVSQGPSMDGPEESFPNYALFGAVVAAQGDPAFVKCTGPEVVIAKEAAAILRLIDSLKVSAN